MQYLLPVLIGGGALVLAGWLIRQALIHQSAPGQTDALGLLQAQLTESGRRTAGQVEALRTSVSESLQALTGQVSQSLTDTSRTMGSRLDTSTKVIGDIRQQLGHLEAASRRMEEMGRDISRLEDILKPPKLRGALGELFLSDLLAQILPTSHYQLQYRFRGGQTVDAVVLLRAGMVPIDAKFPLENFRRILDAKEDAARTTARKAFLKDVKGHIDAIAEKYIRMDEHTFDFALMYIPAENVYYETIIKDDAFGGDLSLFTYALKKRVIPVSPNSFYAYLQTVVLGLKGMRVEERSREILENLSRLRGEFTTFADAFRLVGQHLENSLKKFNEAQRRFGKVESKVDQIDGLAKGLEAGTTGEEAT